MGFVWLTLRFLLFLWLSGSPPASLRSEVETQSNHRPAGDV